MKLRERYRRLGFWSKVGVWGSIASLIALVLAVLPSRNQGGIAISGPVQGPVIISQGQVGGQVAERITNIGRRPRQLSQEALDVLAMSLRRQVPQTYEIEVVEGDPEARALAFQIQGALNAGGWTCSTFANSIFPKPITGFIVSIPTDSTAVSIFVDWARRAALNPKVEILRDLHQVQVLVGSQS